MDNSTVPWIGCCPMKLKILTRFQPPLACPSIWLLLGILTLFAPGSGFASPLFSPIPGGVVAVDLGDVDEPPRRAWFGNSELAVLPLKGRWTTLVPISWDTPPGTYVGRSRDAEGENRPFQVRVRPHRFPIYRGYPNHGDSPKPDDLPLRFRQTILETIESADFARQLKYSDLDFRLPSTSSLTRRFGLLVSSTEQSPRPHPGLRFELATADDILAPQKGTVRILPQDAESRSHNLVVIHNLHFASAFTGFEEIFVEDRAQVNRGQALGRASTGPISSNHPHWILYLEQVPVDPLIFVTRTRHIER